LLTSVAAQPDSSAIIANKLITIGQSRLMAAESGSSASDSRRAMVTPPEAEPSHAIGAVAVGDATLGAAGDMTATTATMLPPYLVDLVRNTVREEIEESEERIQKSILRFHVDMLQQLHTLRIQMQQMVTEHSINPDLVAEIERLREENSRLRRNF
jgi:hypothetical protein